MKLVLFDIDNTIFGYNDVKYHAKIHMQSFMYAAKKVFNIEVTEKKLKPFTGKIDNQIMREIVLAEKGKFTLKKIKKANQLMASYYSKNKHREKMYLHVGISLLLNKLSKHKDVKLGVLTGNISKIGIQKLKRCNLNKYFKVFGFGDSAKDRNELVKKTVKNNYKKVFVIGDTPHDINCGKYIKATTIAVATGPYSFKDLKSADYVFKDFKDYKKLINIIKNAKG